MGLYDLALLAIYQLFTFPITFLIHLLMISFISNFVIFYSLIPMPGFEIYFAFEFPIFILLISIFTYYLRMARLR